jgi:hypothetical protein
MNLTPGQAKTLTTIGAYMMGAFLAGGAACGWFLVFLEITRAIR